MPSNHNDIQSIEDRLRSERPGRKAPENLTDRVMAKLGSDSHLYQQAEVRFWPRFALGFATVALLVAGSFHFMRREPESPSAPQRIIAAAPAEPLNIAIPQLQAVPIGNISLHLDQPLEKELQNVISDARQAIQFVAASFLPEN